MNIEELEKLRKKALLPTLTALIGVFITFIVGVIVTIANPEGKLGLIIILIGFIIMAVSVILLVTINKKDVYEFKKAYKDRYVKGVLEKYFENVDYDFERGFTESEIRAMKLARGGNTYKSEDLLSATYKGVRFRQADVKITKETKGNKNNKTEKIFIGRMFEFETPFTDVHDVRITDKRSTYKETDVALGKNEVKLESVSFNKDFHVNSTDEHSVFYVLTPHMMEGLQKLKNKFLAVNFYFDSNKMYVGIYCHGDAFDHNMFKKINDIDEQVKIKNDINVIMSIVNILKMAEENQ